MANIDYTTPYITADEYLLAKGIDLKTELQDDDNASNKVERFIKDVTDYTMDALLIKYGCNDLNRMNVDFSSLAEFRRKRFHLGMMEQIEYILNNGLIHLDSGINRDNGTVSDFTGLDIGPSAINQFFLGAFCNIKKVGVR